jgi:hypothetical protein
VLSSVINKVRSAIHQVTSCKKMIFKFVLDVKVIKLIINWRDLTVLYSLTCG